MFLRIHLTLLFACGLSAAGGGGENAPTSPTSGESVAYFADNGLGNALAVVQHPAGEYRDGVTYVTYQGPLEDPYVAAYHHATGKWVGPVIAGVSELGKNSHRAM